MTLRRRLEPGDWVKGPPSAASTLIEYGDFQCPFCRRTWRELKRLEAAVGDRVAFAFRHFPITQAHPNALQAAEAAEAAGAQGRFWEMHDLLFEDQQHLEADALISRAEHLSLDLETFIGDLQRHIYVPKIRRQFMEGVRGGVSSTPSFFIDEERYRGPNTAEGLLAALVGEAPPGPEL